jgi:hypothetical protein
MTAGDENELVVGWKLHHLAWRQQGTCGLLAGDHQVAEPRAQAVACVVLGIADLSRRAECIGDPLRGPLVIGGEAHPNMAVVED